MADIKPYERYKKDQSLQPKKKKNIENYTDFQKALLAAIESQTEPKKPVKWFFGKDEKDVGWSTLATQLPYVRPDGYFTCDDIPLSWSSKIKKERLLNLSTLILRNGYENE